MKRLYSMIELMTKHRGFSFQQHNLFCHICPSHFRTSYNQSHHRIHPFIIIHVLVYPQIMNFRTSHHLIHPLFRNPPIHLLNALSNISYLYPFLIPISTTVVTQNGDEQKRCCVKKPSNVWTKKVT